MDELKNLEPNVFKFLQNAALSMGNSKATGILKNITQQILWG